MAKGEYTHVEFPADDVERAKRFYAAVAGWEFGEMEGTPGYWLFQNTETTGGAIGKRGDSVGQGLRLYLNVEQLEAAVAAAETNGGSVITPPSDVPGQGRFAAIRDPEGSEIGLWEAAQS